LSSKNLNKNTGLFHLAGIELAPSAQAQAISKLLDVLHGGDVRCVVTQEGAPTLGRRSTWLDHVLRDAGLSDCKAELEQLARMLRSVTATQVGIAARADFLLN